MSRPQPGDSSSGAEQTRHEEWSEHYGLNHLLLAPTPTPSRDNTSLSTSDHERLADNIIKLAHDSLTKFEHDTQYRLPLFEETSKLRQTDHIVSIRERKSEELLYVRDDTVYPSGIRIISTHYEENSGRPQLNIIDGQDQKSLTEISNKNQDGCSIGKRTCSRDNELFLVDRSDQAYLNTARIYDDITTSCNESEIDTNDTYSVIETQICPDGQEDYSAITPTELEVFLEDNLSENTYVWDETVYPSGIRLVCGHFTPTDNSNTTERAHPADNVKEDLFIRDDTVYPSGITVCLDHYDVAGTKLESNIDILIDNASKYIFVEEDTAISDYEGQALADTHSEELACVRDDRVYPSGVRFCLEYCEETLEVVNTQNSETECNAEETLTENIDVKDNINIEILPHDYERTSEQLQTDCNEKVDDFKQDSSNVDHCVNENIYAKNDTDYENEIQNYTDGHEELPVLAKDESDSLQDTKAIDNVKESIHIRDDKISPSEIRGSSNNLVSIVEGTNEGLNEKNNFNDVKGELYIRDDTVYPYGIKLLSDHYEDNSKVGETSHIEIEDVSDITIQEELIDNIKEDIYIRDDSVYPSGVRIYSKVDEVNPTETEDNRDIIAHEERIDNIKEDLYIRDDSVYPSGVRICSENYEYNSKVAEVNPTETEDNRDIIAHEERIDNIKEDLYIRDDSVYPSGVRIYSKVTEVNPTETEDNRDIIAHEERIDNIKEDLYIRDDSVYPSGVRICSENYEDNSKVAEVNPTETEDNRDIIAHEELIDNIKKDIHIRDDSVYPSGVRICSENYEDNSKVAEVNPTETEDNSEIIAHEELIDNIKKDIHIRDDSVYPSGVRICSENYEDNSKVAEVNPTETEDNSEIIAHEELIDNIKKDIHIRDDSVYPSGVRICSENYEDNYKFTEANHIEIDIIAQEELIYNIKEDTYIRDDSVYPSGVRLCTEHSEDNSDITEISHTELSYNLEEAQLTDYIHEDIYVRDDSVYPSGVRLCSDHYEECVVPEVELKLADNISEEVVHSSVDRHEDNSGLFLTNYIELEVCNEINEIISEDLCVRNDLKEDLILPELQSFDNGLIEATVNLSGKSAIVEKTCEGVTLPHVPSTALQRSCGTPNNWGVTNKLTDIIDAFLSASYALEIKGASALVENSVEAQRLNVADRTPSICEETGQSIDTVPDYNNSLRVNQEGLAEDCDQSQQQLKKTFVVELTLPFEVENNNTVTIDKNRITTDIRQKRDCNDIAEETRFISSFTRSPGHWDYNKGISDAAIANSLSRYIGGLAEVEYNRRIVVPLILDRSERGSVAAGVWGLRSNLSKDTKDSVDIKALLGSSAADEAGGAPERAWGQASSLRAFSSVLTWQPQRDSSFALIPEPLSYPPDPAAPLKCEFCSKRPNSDMDERSAAENTPRKSFSGAVFSGTPGNDTIPPEDLSKEPTSTAMEVKGPLTFDLEAWAKLSDESQATGTADTPAHGGKDEAPPTTNVLLEHLLQSTASTHWALRVPDSDDSPGATLKGYIRICHCGPCSVPGLGSLVAPCHCRGSVALVHLACLDRWLTESGANTCELCGFRFRTERIPRHSVGHSVMLWLSSAVDTKQLVIDLVWFALMTPLAVLAAYLVLLALRVLVQAQDTPWSMVALLVACSITLAAYYGWVAGAVRYHSRDWYRWWRTNYNVHVLSDAAPAVPEPPAASEQLLAVHEHQA